MKVRWKITSSITFNNSVGKENIKVKYWKTTHTYVYRNIYIFNHINCHFHDTIFIHSCFLCLTTKDVRIQDTNENLTITRRSYTLVSFKWIRGLFLIYLVLGPGQKCWIYPIIIANCRQFHRYSGCCQIVFSFDWKYKKPYITFSRGMDHI